MSDLRSNLIRILQNAYSGEVAAAYAYRGHWKSLKPSPEKTQIKKIEDEEWDHRRRVGEWLTKLDSEPNPRREKIFWTIGRTLGLICFVLPWFMPMYFAGRLESQNSVEYEDARFRKRTWNGRLRRRPLGHGPRRSRTRAVLSPGSLRPSLAAIDEKSFRLELVIVDAFAPNRMNIEQPTEPNAKVLFRVEYDDDDSVDVETLWAYDLGEDHYKLDNLPYFAYGVSWHDIVYAPYDSDEERAAFKHVVSKSGNKTIRVFFKVAVQDGNESQALLDRLVEIGCDFEGANRSFIVEHTTSHRAFRCRRNLE